MNQASNTKHLCLVSWTAFMPSRWQTAMALLEQYDIKLTVIAPPQVAIAKVYDPSGYLTPQTASLEQLPGYVKLVEMVDAENPGKGFEPKALHRVLQDAQPDIIWIHSEPTQQTTRDICSWYWRSWPNRPAIYQAAIENLLQYPKFWSLGDRLLLHRVTKFLVASNSTAENLHQSLKIANRRIETTYLPNQGVKPHSRLPLSCNRHVIGFAGRLVPEKGINVLLEALDLVAPSVTLVTAGEGDSDIEARLGNHPRVEHLGLIDNPEELFSRINTLVVPSMTTRTWKEQFGRIIAEAMSFGLPVIGSDSGSVPDVIGDAGLTYQQNSAHDLAKCITQLAENPGHYKQLAGRATDRFEHEFSIEAHARKLAGVFHLQKRLSLLPESTITTLPEFQSQGSLY